jgi:hypothetical protein
MDGIGDPDAVGSSAESDLLPHSPETTVGRRPKADLKATTVLALLEVE